MRKSARDIAAPSPVHHRPADPLALAKSDGVADQKRSHHGFRGVPPPPLFDFDALPDRTLLNEHETAAVGRWSTNTLAAWRLRKVGLRWVVIAGGFVRYRVADIRAYLADATPRKRKPKPPPPAAAPPRRRADVKPRSRGDAVPAAREHRREGGAGRHGHQAGGLTMAEDNSNPLIAYVANVIEEQLHELDRRRVAAKPGPTQVVRPPFFDNKNEFYAPLVQVVPTAERMLSDKVTRAEIKHVLKANAKAVRQGGKLTAVGYSADAWAAIQERAAEKIPTKRSTLDGDNRTATNRRHQLWQDDADKIWKKEPDLTKQQVAERIVELKSDPDEPGTMNWIKRHIIKK